MTRDEMAALLGLMAARDGRTVGRIEVEAWHEDAGQWDFATARVAVARHYQRSRDFLRPADLLAAIREIRNDRIDRTEMPVPNANPDDPAAYAAEYRALRLAIADGTLDGDRLEAYRRGEISLTGRPALTGPMSDPNPETGPAIVREALRGQQEAAEAHSAAEAARAAAMRDAEEAERARQLAALEAMPTRPYGIDLTGRDGHR